MPGVRAATAATIASASGGGVVGGSQSSWWQSTTLPGRISSIWVARYSGSVSRVASPSTLPRPAAARIATSGRRSRTMPVKYPAVSAQYNRASGVSIRYPYAPPSPRGRSPHSRRYVSNSAGACAKRPPRRRCRSCSGTSTSAGSPSGPAVQVHEWRLGSTLARTPPGNSTRSPAATATSWSVGTPAFSMRPHGLVRPPRSERPSGVAIVDAPKRWSKWECPMRTASAASTSALDSPFGGASATRSRYASRKYTAEPTRSRNVATPNHSSSTHRSTL